MHSNGIISFWSPFFLYKNLLPSSIINASKIIRIICTLFFSVLNLFFVFKILIHLFPNNKDISKIIGICFLTTSYWWHTLVQVGNADITLSALTSFWILIFLKAEKFSLSVYYFWGLIGGLGIITKVDFLFYLHLPIYHILILNKSAKEKLLRTFLGLIGMLTLIAPALLNSYIKNGFINYGYQSVIQFEYFNLFGNFFYPSGNFSTTPIFFFLTITFIVGLIKFNKEKISILLIVISPFLEILIESFGRIHQENFGSRHWINDFAAFCILLMLTWNFVKKIKYGRLSFYLISIFCFFIMLYKNYIYRFFPDHYFLGKPLSNFFIAEISSGKFIDNYSFLLKFSYDKLYFIPLIFLSSIVLFYIIKEFSISSKSIMRLGITLSLIYYIGTFLNFYNNHSNAEKYEQNGLFIHSMIGNGPNVYSTFENLETSERLIRFHQYRGNLKKVEFLIKNRRNYIEKATMEISKDPLGIKQKLLSSEFFITENLLEE